MFDTVIIKYNHQQHLISIDFANQMFKDYRNPTEKEWMMYILSVDITAFPIWSQEYNDHC